MKKNYCNRKTAAILRRGVASAEKSKEKFDMGIFFYTGRTPGCLYGHIAVNENIRQGQNMISRINKRMGLNPFDLSLSQLRCWRAENIAKYLAARTYKGRISALRAEVELFIKTGGE